MINKLDKRKVTIDLIRYIIYAIFNDLENGISIKNINSINIIKKIKPVLISKCEKTSVYNVDNTLMNDLIDEIELVTEDIIDICDPYDIEYYKLVFSCVYTSIKEDIEKYV